MDNPVSMLLEVSPKLDEKLSHLAQVSGTSPAQVLLKAITLFEVASQAKQNNQHLGILDSDQRVVAQVIGV